MKTQRFEIRVRETFTVVESANTFDEALDILKQFESEDTANGDFEEDYWCIYDLNEEKVVY